MFEGMTYEELNSMVENPRSEPYEEYFGDMEISESEKKTRISLAEKFEDEFLFILIWLFTMQQYGDTVDWDAARLQFISGYKIAINGYADLDEYTKRHIEDFSYNVIDSTKSHEGDIYYYSIDRAIFISENESQGTMNHQQFINAIKSGKKKKQWIDIRDKRERKTHRKVGGKIKPINDPFLVGNSLMLYPKDTKTFGAEAKEYINCRCTIKYY